MRTEQRINDIKSFLYSYHFSNGLRTTISVVVPSLVFAAFGKLDLGIAMSMGALCTALSDVPGTIVHKRNGLIISTILIFFTALGTGLLMPYVVPMGIWILLCCFVFAMMLVYGNRGGNIGTGALLVMVSMLGETQLTPALTLLHSSMVLLGSLWYAVLALILWQIRPYLNVQQALGDCILQTARYLEVRANFYTPGVDVAQNFKAVLAQQVIVNEKQEHVRELLLKRRSAQQGTTSINKSMVLIFLDMVDLQEQIMASQTDYNALQKDFKGQEILEKFHALILEFTEELKTIGLAVASGQRSLPRSNLKYDMEKVKKAIADITLVLPTLKERTRTIPLTNILQNLQDMAQRIYNLHRLTRLERLKDASIDPKLELSKFTTRQKYDLETFRDNLTFKSHIFRHAIRVSLATVTGYTLGAVLHLDRVYWILLTIVVILKPGFGLTRSRSIQRLIGTVTGALFAAALLYLTHNDTVIFISMLLCILGAYSFMSFQYTVSVFFVTPFIIFLLHFLHPSDLYNVTQRVLDTFIGGGLAFVANMVLWPTWEHNFVPDYMKKMMVANRKYFELVLRAYSNETVPVTDFKLARKDTYVATANMMSAFQRMLSEPKSKQKDASRVYHLVVLNHTLTSHTAALAAYSMHHGVQFPRPEYREITDYLLHYMDQLILMIDPGTAAQAQPAPPVHAFDRLDAHLENLVHLRQQEINEGKGATPTRDEMLETKQVHDQLTAIFSLMKDMSKAAGKA
ncbi:FUSC family protein [Chitinophaga nivalis]|uniref:FUSC family protein n=1 Tax=Chitinophaga nivalis TaxID=2991709 RepID=A0ABT3INQ3_9BACT|nr:FUSC family membrane protein [Chitinophaga nivalis]MCW3464692.1 FUSC family protein [Chitinophaga nivalis]MCW3485617.1 FUSC family protein [Chitinophaga nivalis]